MDTLKLEKISQATKILDELDIDAWVLVEKESGVLSDPVARFLLDRDATWLSLFFLFRNGEKIALIGSLDIEKFKQLELFDEIITYKDSCKESLLKILQERQPNKIALNYSENSPVADGLTYGKFLQLNSLLDGTDFGSRFVSAESIISKMNGRKSQEEVRRIQKAVDITLEIYDTVVNVAQAGQTEKDLAAFLKDERNKRGLLPSWEEEHNPAVFAGPQETGAHSGPTDTTLQKGHVFNIDFGVKYEGYCSDLQRTWYLLKDNETVPPEEVLKGFAVIKESIQRAFAALKPGVNGVDIDTIARSYITSQGYDEFPHALGHQVGRNAHDGGALLAPAWDRYGTLPFTPLEEGQVFTIEPRLYLKEHGVVTVEEMVYITATGAEWLSKPQEALYCIPG